jgi:hypothetical protein
LYSPPAIASSNGLWYLAQTTTGIVLDHICGHGATRCLEGRFVLGSGLCVPRSQVVHGARG